MPPAIATFHGRRGRLGPRGRDALARLLPTFGVDVEGSPVRPESFFAHPLPVVVEIGCGRGEATASFALAQPDTAILAADVHTAGIAALLLACEEHHLDNVRVALGDGVELLRNRIPSASLAGIRAFFPDPWPKVRHHKRRLLRPHLVAVMSDRLRPGGALHVATDWRPYADEMLAVLTQEPLLRNCSPDGFSERPAWRPVTAYEAKAQEAGRPTRELLFRRA